MCEHERNGVFGVVIAVSCGGPQIDDTMAKAKQVLMAKTALNTLRVVQGWKDDTRVEPAKPLCDGLNWLYEP